MRRLAGLVLVIGLAGCGGTAQSQTVATHPAATTASTTATTAASPTTTTEEAVTASSSCQVSLFDASVALLRRSWDRVTASRAGTDHPERVQSFADDVKSMVEDVDAVPSGGQTGCGIIELAQLNLDAAKLNLNVVMGKDEDAAYKDVADSANRWVEKVGLLDQVKPFTSTYVG